MTNKLARLFPLAMLTLVGGLLLGAAPAPSTDASAVPGAAFVLTVVGSINAGTADYISRGIGEAQQRGASLVVLEMDTPGGFLQATRSIVKAILNAPLPVVVYVAPRGARAGSAGVFITLAGHVAAMSPGTNIGAAHPVAGGGKDPEKSGGKHMAKKIENDTLAFISAIAKQRKRNVKWARKAVKESASVTAGKALRLRVIDLIAQDLPDLLRRLDQRKVRVNNREVTLQTKNIRVVRLQMSFKQKLVNFFADPNIAYFLLMFGILGIMMEIYNPGSIFPGVLGGICLFLAFIAMQVLPINYGGLALLLLGALLLVAELFTASFGVLFTGGMISLLVGSILLIDSPDPSLRLSLWTIVPTLSVLGVLVAVAMTAVVRAYRSKPSTGEEGMVGETGTVRNELAPQGTVRIHGEQWNAESASGETIPAGTPIYVVAARGLKLQVKPISSKAEHDRGQQAPKGA